MNTSGGSYSGLQFMIGLIVLISFIPLIMGSDLAERLNAFER